MQDYACPRNDDFVILELENTDSTGNTLTELSDPDLLMWFAENARTKDSPGFGGFLLEELPCKNQENRLFRLPPAGRMNLYCAKIIAHYGSVNAKLNIPPSRKIT